MATPTSQAGIIPPEQSAAHVEIQDSATTGLHSQQQPSSHSAHSARSSRTTSQTSPSGSPRPSTAPSSPTHSADSQQPPANSHADLWDDVFGPTDELPTSMDRHPEITPQQRQIYHPAAEHSDERRLRSIHSTAGYRDGAAKAREAAVQGGFDEGFLLGAAVGVRVGVLRGLVKGLLVSLSMGDVEGTSAALKGSTQTGEVVGRLRALDELMARELRLENMLGQMYMLQDGSWGWEVDELALERFGIEAVAEAHPLVRKYCAIVGRWCDATGVGRLDDGVDKRV